LTIAGFFGTFIVSLGGEITGLVMTEGAASEDVFGEAGSRSGTWGCMEGRTEFWGKPASWLSTSSAGRSGSSDGAGRAAFDGGAQRDKPVTRPGMSDNEEDAELGED